MKCNICVFNTHDPKSISSEQSNWFHYRTTCSPTSKKPGISAALFILSLRLRNICLLVRVFSAWLLPPPIMIWDLVVVRPIVANAATWLIIASKRIATRMLIFDADDLLVDCRRINALAYNKYRVTEPCFFNTMPEKWSKNFAEEDHEKRQGNESAKGERNKNQREKQEDTIKK